MEHEMKDNLKNNEVELLKPEEENGIIKELKTKVRELSELKKEQEDDIIKKLQEINEFFLRNFKLRVKANKTDREIEVEPIQIEAYYYKAEIFEDEATHRCYLQKHRFGKLYFHKRECKECSHKEECNRHRGRDGRIGGIDIVLSDSCDYYLSLLLKTSKIGGNFFSQNKIADEIKNTDYEDVLCVRDKDKDDTVLKTLRIGVNKGAYKCEWLGAIIGKDIFRMPIKKSKLTFAGTCFGKEKIVEHYMDEDGDLEEADIKYLLGYIPRTLKEKLKNRGTL